MLSKNDKNNNNQNKYPSAYDAAQKTLPNLEAQPLVVNDEVVHHCDQHHDKRNHHGKQNKMAAPRRSFGHFWRKFGASRHVVCCRWCRNLCRPSAVSRIDKFARLGFPLAFLIFHFVYGAVVAYWRKHYADEYLAE